MRVSHSHRFVFLSYPRTASRSIRKVLDPYSDVASVLSSQVSGDDPFWHHMPAKDVKRVFDSKGWDWHSYRRFCVVRNPYARIVSLYHHYLQLRKTGSPGLAPFPRMKAQIKYLVKPAPSFREFVLESLEARRVGIALDEFILDDTGAPLVDDVLRYEKLPSQLPECLQQLGIEFDAAHMPIVGHSGIRSYSQLYDDDTRSYIASHYQYEMERFGYHFEEIS